MDFSGTAFLFKLQAYIVIKTVLRNVRPSPRLFLTAA